MRNRITVIWVTVLALILALLLMLSFLAGREGYGNLLMVAPSAFGTPGLSPEKLEKLSDEEFLLTYGIRQPAKAQAVNSRHSVILVGTNHKYASVMGYLLLDGGFFTEAAMGSGSKHAVLNETAAFQLFGGNRISGNILKLNGEAWIVTGVIQDNDEENANIYVPAGIMGGQADSIMVLMDGTVTEAYVKNALKSIGIHESSYDFINLSKSAGAFVGRFAVAWKSVLLVAILLFMLRTAGRLLEKLRNYRDEARELYFRELFARHRADFLKATGGGVLLVAGTGAMLAISLQILGTCLAWQELMPITGELAAGDFGPKLLWLRDYQTLGWVLFGVCVCLTFLGLILNLGRTGNGGNNGKKKGAGALWRI